MINLHTTFKVNLDGEIITKIFYHLFPNQKISTQLESEPRKNLETQQYACLTFTYSKHKIRQKDEVFYNPWGKTHFDTITQQKQ